MRVTTLLCFMFERQCVRKCFGGKLADEKTIHPIVIVVFFFLTSKLSLLHL